MQAEENKERPEEQESQKATVELPHQQQEQQQLQSAQLPSITESRSFEAETEAEKKVASTQEEIQNGSTVGKQINETQVNGIKEKEEGKRSHSRKHKERSRSAKRDKDKKKENKERSRSGRRDKDKKREKERDSADRRKDKKDSKRDNKDHRSRKSEKRSKSRQKRSRSRETRERSRDIKKRKESSRHSRRRESEDDDRNKKSNRSKKDNRDNSRSRSKSKRERSRNDEKYRDKKEKENDRKRKEDKKKSRKGSSKKDKRSTKSSKRKRHNSSSSRSSSGSSDSSSPSSSSSSRSASSRGKNKKRTSSPKHYGKKLSEADLRRIEREKRSVSDYYHQLKTNSDAPSSSARGGKGKQQDSSKFVDSNDQLIDTEKVFWDGFCWQPRLSKTEGDESLLKSTEKQRKIQLQNVPFNLGLDKIDVISYVSNFMKENSLANEGNANPVLACEINIEDGTANLELSSVEETNLMYKSMSFKFFQNECRIVKLGETNVYQPSIQALTQAAIRQAEAQAAVIKATESFLLGDTTMKDGVHPDGRPKRSDVVSPIIKVTNTIELGTENTFSEENWEDLHADLLEEFQRYGDILFHFLVRPYQATVGAKAGTLFVEYSTNAQAEEAMNINDGRTFSGQRLKIYSLQADAFNTNFRPLVSIHQ